MNINAAVIDAHVHCGVQDDYNHQSLEHYIDAIKGTEIEGAVMFPPVIEIYDRYNPDFEDSTYWRDRRQKANEYVEKLVSTSIQVIPYFFIWNDFSVDQITPRHKGIKWHRHMDEPVYHYNTPECSNALETIRSLRMPVVYEEEFENTLKFIRRLAQGIRVIIPHLGGLNGGYHALKQNGIWEYPNVYTDTALAGTAEIEDYIKDFGSQRILFGSDFPFGNPKSEYTKIRNLKFGPNVTDAILGENLKKLLADSNLNS